MIESTLLLLGVFFQRPLILGYYDAASGLLILTASIAVTLSLKKDARLNSAYVYVFLASIPLVLISLGISFLRGASTEATINALAIFFISSIAIMVVTEKNHATTKRLLIQLIRFIIASTFITIVISDFNVEKFSQLSMLTLPIKDRSDLQEFDVLIPLSTIPFRMTPNEYVVLPRSTYWGIEPGVGVFVIMLWRYLEGIKRGIKELILNSVFVAALFATASTTAPLMILSWFAIGKVIAGKNIVKMIDGKFIFSSKKIFVFAIITVISIYLLFYLPHFGILEKSITHGSSFDDRIELNTGEAGILRVLQLTLVVLYYFLIRRFMNDNFLTIYSALFIVSALNVMAFSPIFFLSCFLAIRSSDASRNTNLKSQLRI